MRFHIEKPQLEDREQANGTCPDDKRVSLND
jgi:hypothetical protein